VKNIHELFARIVVRIFPVTPTVKTPEKLLMKIPEMRIAKRIPLRRFSRDIFPEMFSAKFSVTLLAKLKAK
jgi:hypothetical protein